MRNKINLFKLNPLTKIVLQVLVFVFSNLVWFSIVLPRLINTRSDTYLGIGIFVTCFVIVIDLLIVCDAVFAAVVDEITRIRKE